MTGRWWSRLSSVWLVALRDAEGGAPVADAHIASIDERRRAEFGQKRLLTNTSAWTLMRLLDLGNGYSSVKFVYRDRPLGTFAAVR